MTAPLTYADISRILFLLFFCFFPFLRLCRFLETCDRVGDRIRHICSVFYFYLGSQTSGCGILLIKNISVCHHECHVGLQGSSRGSRDEERNGESAGGGGGGEGEGGDVRWVTGGERRR